MATHLAATIVEHLKNGDFSALETYFQRESQDLSPMLALATSAEFGETWIHEALSCAAFLGRIDDVSFMLDHGAISEKGGRSGFDALHYAVNRGHFDLARLLIDRGADLTTVSRFGGTILNTAIWSAVNEPKPQHVAIIRLLIESGASLENVWCPEDREDILALLKQRAGE